MCAPQLSCLGRRIFSAERTYEPDAVIWTGAPERWTIQMPSPPGRLERTPAEHRYVPPPINWVNALVGWFGPSKE